MFKWTHYTQCHYRTYIEFTQKQAAETGLGHSFVIVAQWDIVHQETCSNKLRKVKGHHSMNAMFFFFLAIYFLVIWFDCVMSLFHTLLIHCTYGHVSICM